MSRVVFVMGGAGLMYFFDPNLGRHRRSLLRDRVASCSRQVQDDLKKSIRHLSQQAQGLAWEIRSSMSSDDVADDVLVERARAKMGHYISHASAIHVDARDGQLVLSGPILAEEVEPFLRAMRALSGVKSIDSQLEIHREPGNVSALQGGNPRAGGARGMAAVDWAPETRCCVAIVGGLALARGLLKRHPVAFALGAMLCTAAARQPSARTRDKAPRQPGPATQVPAVPRA